MKYIELPWETLTLRQDRESAEVIVGWKTEGPKVYIVRTTMNNRCKLRNEDSRRNAGNVGMQDENKGTIATYL